MKSSYEKRELVERLKEKYDWYYNHHNISKGVKKMIEQKERWSRK